MEAIETAGKMERAQALKVIILEKPRCVICSRLVTLDTPFIASIDRKIFLCESHAN